VCERSTPQVSDPPEPIGEIEPSGRSRNGRFLAGPGNRGNWRHGGRSKYVAAGETPEQVEALAAMAERRARIETDLGGRDNLSQLAADSLSDYLRLRFVGEYLAESLIKSGPLTSKGRQRAALNAYLSVVDRTQRIAASLGFSRREKPVPTISEYLARRPAGGGS
jgi:hypothetical protein